MKYKHLLFPITAFGFMGGIFYASVAVFTKAIFLSIFIVGFFFLIFYILKKKTLLIFLAFFFISASIGVAHFFHKQSFWVNESLDSQVGEKVTLEGVVVKEPEDREKFQQLILELETPEEVRVVVRADLYPKFSYGDLVSVSGKLQVPENFETIRGREFDYVNYLAKDNIFYIVSFADVELLDVNQGKALIEGLLRFKKTFINKIQELVPEPESSLLNGVLLGVKEDLGKDLQQDFIDTGTIHIVVLSGYNVTIVAEAIIRGLGFLFLPLSVGLWLGIIGIAMFALITGAGATVVRASIMAVLALVARLTGNTYMIGRALILAAVVMLIYNPFVLVFDISFQLSFLATLGLIYIAPLIEKYFTWIPKFFGFREIIVASLATQVTVLPYLLYSIGVFSVISPIVNALVLPLIPITMLFGFITGVLGLIHNVLAIPFAWIAYLFLTIEIGLVVFFSKLPFATFELPQIPFWFVVGLYVFIIYWVSKKDILSLLSKLKKGI